MTVVSPPRRPDETPVSAFDIIGHRERGHLSHLGFAVAAAEVSKDDEITVIDARPIRRKTNKLSAHAIGRLKLTRRERLMVGTWLRRRALHRTLAGDYLVAVDEPLRDSESGRIYGRQQSCAGLVHTCLAHCAGVELIDLSAVPKSSREQLTKLWGDKTVQLAEYRGELQGEGPWALLLPAHVFHALARADPRASSLRPRDIQWDFK